MQPQPIPHDCTLCPRLAGFRQDNRLKYPEFFNNPVPSFGELDAELLVVGLAPGLKGANQTGRPFTGDYAGLVLYGGLISTGFATGQYGETPDDGLKLLNCRITNAVRCVPPENKPETSEIKQCNGFLKSEIAAMPNLKAILTLGLISHNAVLRALGYKQSHAKFGHGNVHHLSIKNARSVDRASLQPAPCENQQIFTGAIRVFNSYHCSRYNINTGRLTQEMFDSVLKNIQAELATESAIRR